MNNSKRFSERFATFFLVAAGFVLASCSNLSLNMEEKDMSVKDGYAAISLAVGLKGSEKEAKSLESNARTVMPKADANNSASGFTDICLYAKLSSDPATLGTTDTLLAKWKNYNEMQIKPYSEPITAGTYDFMLTAKNYGATMTQTLTGKTLASGSTTKLNFTSLSADPSGVQTGSIQVNLYYHPYNHQVAEDFKKYVQSIVSPYVALSISLDSNLIGTKDSSTASIKKTDETGNMYEIDWNSTSFTSAPVNAGFHIVSFTFTAGDGSVFVYPVPVHVEAGYLSEGDFYPFMSPKTATQNAGTQSYTVTYNSNTPSAAVKTQTFYPGSSIADAEALGFTSEDGKRFKEWNTEANGSGTAYKSGSTPPLTGNLTLYAQWANFKKVTYIINIESAGYPPSMRNDFYVQKYETGNTLVTHTAAFSDFTSSTDAGKYTFCGWDTAENGSGTRYADGASPALTEDTILYAQWCGKKTYLGYYSVKDAKQWNALMGAPFANTVSGTITADISLEVDYLSSNTISNPALSLTTGKTFKGEIVSTDLSLLMTISGFSEVLFDKIAAGSKIKYVNIKGPVCNTNEGTIDTVTVSGVQMSGYAPIAKINAAGGLIDSCTVQNCTVKGIKPASGESFVGGICNENLGEIKNCEVRDCTIDGETHGIQFTGGICGKNSGTISGTGTLSGHSTKVTGTVKGSSSAGAYEAVYTGGYCGYNSGNIPDKGEINITLSGCNDEKGHKGYVTGKNETNAVNEDSSANKVSSQIKVAGWKNGKVIINLENETLGSGSTWTSDTFSLEENTKVYFLLQDSSGGSKTNKETLKLLTSDGTPVKVFVSTGTPNIETSIYLNKGTYKLSRYNGNGLYTSKMDIKIVRY
ncbi:InlB B-repeat-containing protein [Treponema vincentii]|uniref:InlB B-repeat-containing protein n=1 Tax=Treponema vincentii TaxID=69710 RepID=UPI003D8B8F4B